MYISLSLGRETGNLAIWSGLMKNSTQTQYHSRALQALQPTRKQTRHIIQKKNSVDSKSSQIAIPAGMAPCNAM